MIFQGIEPMPDEEPKWYGGMQTSLTEWGDYIPTGSWKFDKSLTHQWSFSEMKISHIVNIYGVLRKSNKFWSRTYRPVSFHSYLQIHNYYTTVTVARGKCNSIKKALACADAAVTEEHKKQVLRKFYSKNNVACLYREEDGKWLEFMTVFGYTDSLFSKLPYGKYREINHHGPKKFIWDIKYEGYRLSVGVDPDKCDGPTNGWVDYVKEAE